MTQEALKLALEALDGWRKGFPDNWGDLDTEAVTAIKEALADHIPDTTKMVSQPEQKPVIDKSAAIRIATVLGWTPPRTWVGLTKQQQLDIFAQSVAKKRSEHEHYMAIEQALKERNQ